jgi:hypothetical protein
MKKILICLVMLSLLSQVGFTATSGGLESQNVNPILSINSGHNTIYNKTDTDVSANKNVWSTAAISKRAYVSDIIISAAGANKVTITDAETTPNTLVVLYVSAGGNTVVNFNVPLIGSKPTTTSALGSIKATASTSTVNITLLGWEK